MIRPFLFACLLTSACAGNTPGPVLASSNANPAYAQQYSSELERLVVRIEAQRQAASASIEHMQQFAVQIGPSDPETVADLYLQADQEGRSEAFANYESEAMVIQSFFAEKDTQLTQRIAASVEYAAKKNGCEVQLAPAAQRGLQRGIQDQLEKRRRSTSAAQRRVVQMKDSLGPKAAAELPAQLDEISLTSYFVYVGLEADELRLSQNAERIGSIRATLEDDRNELSEMPDPDAEELKRVDAALVELTKQENRTQLTLQDVEARRTQLRHDYEKALDALVESARHQAPRATPVK